ncbi:hypothetical protein [Chryseobacterium terrae]|uniref:Uncharacterized protein n=1 Tax=Chryseobacterium terrae TaxID=3163299 RepID=A0ABW8Y6I2_9FLAO
MIFIDTIENINNFIISKINFQDNDIQLTKNYYLLVDDVAFNGDFENQDFEAINFDEFLSQPNIDFIIHKYETLLVSEIEYYQQDFITTFANHFRNCNTELSQKMLYEGVVISLSNCISRFSEFLNNEADFITLNKIQRITLTSFNEAHSGIAKMIGDEFEKYINPKIDLESQKTIFGLDLSFVEKLYNELKNYELFNKNISKNEFFKILNIDYKGENKIELKLNRLPDFYYFVKFLKDKYSSSHMAFYEHISKRFLVSTIEKDDISFKSKKISDGISYLNTDTPSRVVKNGSEIISFVKTLT